MGVKSGIVLAFIGLLFALSMAALYSAALTSLQAPVSGGGLAGALLAGLAVGIPLLLGGGAFIFSSLFYLIAHLTSKHTVSKALGILFMVGGALIMFAVLMIAAVMLPRYRGSSAELLPFAAFFTVQATVGLLITVAGVRKIWRS